MLLLLLGHYLPEHVILLIKLLKLTLDRLLLAQSHLKFLILLFQSVDLDLHVLNTKILQFKNVSELAGQVGVLLVDT